MEGRCYLVLCDLISCLKTTCSQVCDLLLGVVPCLGGFWGRIQMASHSSVHILRKKSKHWELNNVEDKESH